MALRPEKIERGEKPEYFVPALVAGIAKVASFFIKTSAKETAEKIQAMADKASERLSVNAAVISALMADMTPFRKNNAFYAVAAVGVILIVVTGIILYKRK